MKLTPGLGFDRIRLQQRKEAPLLSILRGVDET